MKVFYHDDLDGHCAGYIVAKANGCTKKDMDDFIEINYDKEFPFDIIAKDEKVIIVDYSIEPHEMDQLLEITKSVYWFDHHKTSIEKYKDYPEFIMGYRTDGVAGCVITWKYMFPGVEVPYAVVLIGDRDVWTWEHGDDTKFFCNYAESVDTHPLSNDWEELLLADIELFKMGRAIEQYKAQRNKDYYRKYAFMAKFEGYDAIVANIGMVGSEFFDGTPLPPLQIMYAYNGEKYLVSLRSTEIDVSELAKKYGGGGHAGAAGFETKEDMPSWLSQV